MNSTITKILFEKISWIAINLFWVIPALISLNSSGDISHRSVVTQSIVIVGLFCFFILSLSYVFNLGIQIVVTSLRFILLYVRRASEVKKVSNFDIHFASRAWWKTGWAEHCPDIKFWSRDHREQRMELDPKIYEQVHPRGISQGWYDWTSLEDIKEDLGDNSDRIGVGFLILFCLLFFFWIVVYTHVDAFNPLGNNMSLLMTFLTFGSTVVSLITRLLSRAEGRMNRYNDYADDRNVAQIKLKNNDAATTLDRIWNGLEIAKYKFSWTKDHDLIHSRFHHRLIPERGSIWQIGDVLYWNQREIEISKYNRLLEPVAFPICAHQLPPSGHYEFKFPVEIPEPINEQGDSYLLNDVELLQWPFFSKASRMSFRSTGGLILEGFEQDFNAEMNIAPLFEFPIEIPSTTSWRRRSMLDTESIRYFLRFADHYSWTVTHLEIGGSRYHRNLSVTFFLEKLDPIQYAKSAADFDWNNARDGWRFDNINVDLRQQKTE